MAHINAAHLEVRPTHEDDDDHTGKLPWSVYLVNRVYEVGKRYIDGPFEESSSLYSQHATFEEADNARRASTYC